MDCIVSIRVAGEGMVRAMTAVYTNRMGVEIDSIARLVFVDERMAEVGKPKPTAVVAEVAMTIDNLKSLHAAIGETLKKVGYD